MTWGLSSSYEFGVIYVGSSSQSLCTCMVAAFCDVGQLEFLTKELFPGHSRKAIPDGGRGLSGTSISWHAGG